MRVNVQVNKIIGYFHIQKAEKVHQWKNIEVNRELLLINNLASCHSMHKPSITSKYWPLQRATASVSFQQSSLAVWIHQAGFLTGSSVSHHLRKGYLKDECCITTGWGTKANSSFKPDNSFWHLETFYPSKILDGWTACLNLLFLWRPEILKC